MKMIPAGQPYPESDGVLIATEETTHGYQVFVHGVHRGRMIVGNRGFAWAEGLADRVRSSDEQDALPELVAVMQEVQAFLTMRHPQSGELRRVNAVLLKAVGIPDKPAHIERAEKKR